MREELGDEEKARRRKNFSGLGTIGQAFQNGTSITRGAEKEEEVTARAEDCPRGGAHREGQTRGTGDWGTRSGGIRIALSSLLPGKPGAKLQRKERESVGCWRGVRRLCDLAPDCKKREGSKEGFK